MLEFSQNMQNAWCNITASNSFAKPPLDGKKRSIICYYNCQTLIDIFNEILKNNNVNVPVNGNYIDIALNTLKHDTTLPDIEWLKKNIDQYIPYLYPNIIMSSRKEEDLLRDTSHLYEWIKKYYIINH